MDSIFVPGSDRFDPDLLGPDGLRALLTMSVAMNDRVNNPEGSLFPNFDPVGTYVMQRLFIVGMDGLSDPNVLVLRYRHEGVSASAGDSSTDTDYIRPKA